MIYCLFENTDCIAETDSLDLLKQLVKEHPDCTVKELRSGKVYQPKTGTRRVEHLESVAS